MCEDDSIEIINLKNTCEIDEIVNIHLDSFQNFFLTYLGKGFLKQLYLGYFFDENSDILIAKKGNTLIGFLAFSKDYSNLFKKLLKQRFVYFAYYSLIAFLKKPSIIFRLLSAFSKSDQVKLNEKYVELASIAVKPEYAGSNIGSLLINNLIDLVDFHDFGFINLETDGKNNDNVINFYEKNGFRKHREYFTKQKRLMFEFRFYPEKGED